MLYAGQYELFNLRNALIAFILTPLLLIMGLGGWYLLNTLEKHATASMREDIELIARSIRLPLSHALESGQHEILLQTLLSAFDIRRVYGIHVYDQHGKPVATGGSTKALILDRYAVTQTTMDGEKGTFDNKAGEPVFSYFVPLIGTGGQITGLLQVTRRGSDFTHYIDQLRVHSLAFLLGAGALFLLVIYTGYRHIVGRPLHAISDSMARIATGAGDHRIPLQGPAEIRDLSQGINTMLDGITASEQEIRRRRDNEYQLERQLRQNEKLAAIGRLAAGVAHELGTPLSVADGKAQRGLRQAEEPARTTLTEIREQLSRMTSIVRQLMNFARSNTLNLRTLQLANTVQTCILQLQQDYDREGVVIETPATASPVQVQADPLRLEQAIINLLLNAIQAARHRILITWELVHDTLILTVDDDGPGVPSGSLDRIFEPFYTTKNVGKGTGLGLAIVAAVVAEHEGRVTVTRSQLGGARFQLHLPIVRENAPCPA